MMNNDLQITNTEKGLGLVEENKLTHINH